MTGLYDFASEAARSRGGWGADGVLHLLDATLPRAELLADPCLSRVFAHLQGRRRLPEPAARRLVSLLTTVPLAAPAGHPGKSLGD
jgi:hypothetical protein